MIVVGSANARILLLILDFCNENENRDLHLLISISFYYSFQESCYGQGECHVKRRSRDDEVEQYKVIKTMLLPNPLIIVQHYCLFV
jgi:hypothetical protein